MLLGYCFAVPVDVVALAPAVVASQGHPQQRSKRLPASSTLIDNLLAQSPNRTDTYTQPKPRERGDRTKHTHTQIDFTFPNIEESCWIFTVAQTEKFFCFLPYTTGLPSTMVGRVINTDWLTGALIFFFAAGTTHFSTLLVEIPGCD